jgi:hypothetical protein
VKKLPFIFVLFALICGVARAANLDELIADRAAIERVYYRHRIGATEPFESAVPAADLRRLVERDLAREQALRSRYGEEINSNQIAAEATRIDKTTRAPATLAEIKAALGNDPARIDRSFVKPLLVERDLRSRFENDDAIHASVRRECETARTNLLAARSAGAAPARLVAELMQSHPNAVAKATWSLAPRVAAAQPGAESQTRYLEELPAQLRQVLAAQLRAAGDVSAVIELPQNFLLFVAEEKNEKSLTAACLDLPKQNCDTWLAAQNSNIEK